MSPTPFDLAPFQDPLTIQRVLNNARTVAIVGLSKNELLQTLSRPEYHLKSVTTSHTKKGDVALLAELHATELDPAPLERAVSRLTLDPKVTSARWWLDETKKDDDEDEF